MNERLQPGEGAGVPGLVSVIIPTFNRGYMLRRAIDSVLRQSYRDVEVLIADDGSTDDTAQIVRSYGAPVRYFHQCNSGVSAARNLGLRHARGEFIALLDSDDTFFPWKLEAQVTLLRHHPEVGMVWTDMVAASESGEIVSRAYLREMYSAHQQVRIEEISEGHHPLGTVWPNAPLEIQQQSFYPVDLFSSMILGNLVHTSTVVLRRDRLRRVGGFDEALRPAGEDYEFHLRTTFEGRVGFLDAASIVYRVGAADQLTAPSHMAHIARNNLTTVTRWVERGRDRITLSPGVLRDRLAESYGWAGMSEMEEHQTMGRGTAAMFRSLRYRPLQPRVILYTILSIFPGAVQRRVRELYGRFAERRRSAIQSEDHLGKEGVRVRPLGDS